MRLTAIAAAVLVGCNLGAPLQLDGATDAGHGRDGADGASTGDATGSDVGEEESGWDSGLGEGNHRGGAFSLVTSRVEITDERLCDIDDDGVLDNSIAELGSPMSQLFVMAFGTLLDGVLVDDVPRLVAHFPWVDDLRTPRDLDTHLILYEGIDSDGDRSNDLSGNESFSVAMRSLDECGEPLHYFPSVRIDGGLVETGAGTIPLPAGEGTATAHVVSSLGLVGRSTDACGYFLIEDLGIMEGFSGTGELSLLEVILSGGATFGADTVPGLDPDLDFDGDGLERIEVDVDHRVERCIDGDGTVILGRECWRDERMSDAFSITLHLRFEGARFAGREPLWESVTEQSCPGGHPEPSLWDPQ